MSRKGDVIGAVSAGVLLVVSMLFASDGGVIGPMSARSAEGRVVFGGGSELPFWNAGASFPAGAGVVRYAWAQCPTMPDSVFIISGVDESFSVTANTWRYDAGTDTWNPLAPIPAGAEGLSAACWQDRIFVLGGGGTNQHFIYDIGTDSWSSGAPLPRPVWGAAVGAWAGSIYMVGGDTDFSFGGTSNEVNIYDVATNTWVGFGAPMPEAAVTAGRGQAGSLLYVAGGWGDSSPTNNVVATQRYDMATDSWSTGPPFSSGRADLVLAVGQANLYAAGGDADGGGAFDATDLVEYLPYGSWPGGSWMNASDPLPSPLTAQSSGACTSAMSGGEIWSQGGLNGLFVIVGTNSYRPIGEMCYRDLLIFEDGFESGDVSAWSTSIP